MSQYSEAAERIRRALPGDPEVAELIGYAALASNGHNTQPWQFVIGEAAVSILPDYSRRTPVVDPDDHHLFISLGCAAENFSIAAKAHGRDGTVVVDLNQKDGIDIALGLGPTEADDLYEAIPHRQSTRSIYDGRAVSVDELKRLAAAAAIDGVSIRFITDEADRETVLDAVIEGNNVQLETPEFVRELKDWIRFSATKALRTGDGLFAGCLGNPAAPEWLGRRIFDLVVNKHAEARKYSKQIRSSAGLAIFMGAHADKDHWVCVGRSFQRFALQATALGIRHAHVNQPVEVPAVRKAFARWLGIGDARPDLVIRFGHAPALPMSMRRPVEHIIAAS